MSADAIFSFMSTLISQGSTIDAAALAAVRKFMPPAGHDDEAERAVFDSMTDFVKDGATVEAASEIALLQTASSPESAIRFMRVLRRRLGDKECADRFVDFYKKRARTT